MNNIEKQMFKCGDKLGVILYETHLLTEKLYKKISQSNMPELAGDISEFTKLTGDAVNIIALMSELSIIDQKQKRKR